MDLQNLGPADHAALQDILGYLNFSSGAPDAKFLASLNALYGLLLERGVVPENMASTLHSVLTAKLAELHGSSPAFQEAEQSQAVLALVFDKLWPAYRQHHGDLLANRSDEALLNGFFVGRMAEAVLSEGPPWQESDRIVAGALVRLNDFLGHRPVAVLHSAQKIEPYSHERVRPVPLYIAGAGVTAGPYHDLLKMALEILRGMDRGLLQAAHFELEHLSELALDPRAYDFNHPVNKRPNYHFGQWDPHLIDRHGYYRRFVVPQVTLDALLARVTLGEDKAPREELLYEAAVVLAGTILMASGTSGSGPEAHDSMVTLTSLMPRIAAYRDAYYRTLLEQLSGKHAERLRDEAVRLRQPMGAARQHLNAQLARQRALHLQHVRLALLFARMGFAEAARRQAAEVPVASARMLCEIECLLAEANHSADREQLAQALASLTQIEELVNDGIECGAIVDPWNILGFGGQFSLFPSPESSVVDHRVDDLTELMGKIFDLYSRVWHKAAASDDLQIEAELPARFRRLAQWWNQFATASISGIRRVNGPELFASGEAVAQALRAWHKAGVAAGDVAFWRPHAERFDSPAAYARVIESLLEHADLPAAMALLMHWLSQADLLEAEDPLDGFHPLALRWLHLTLCGKSAGQPAAGAAEKPQPAVDSTKTIARFFDFLEANADTYWQVPRLDTDGAPPAAQSGDPSRRSDEVTSGAEGESDDEGENLYQAAYDEVVYRDSTADGIDANMLESGPSHEAYELEAESARLGSRLSFLTTLARLWKQVALAKGAGKLSGGDLGVWEAWHAQADANQKQLIELARAIERRSIASVSANQESLEDYDRRRIIKESLQERIISTAVAMNDAERMLGAALTVPSSETEDAATASAEPQQDGNACAKVWAALLGFQPQGVRAAWSAFLTDLRQQPLLYVPLAKAGAADKIITARSTQQMLRELLRRLPRLGLLRETFQLLQAARAMEREHPLGAGAVTEFDRLFEIGYKGIVEALIESANAWTTPGGEEGVDGQLVECLQTVTENMLAEWLVHSRTLRLSALERVAAENDWKQLVEFIQTYGHDLFTQRFFHLGNMRAILHEGVDAWLEQLASDPDAAQQYKLVADLDGAISRADARRHISMVLESIVENFAEYRDFNTTTTQSDRGEHVYMLLDFLRIKAAYDRVHWNLRPVVMAHEVLARRGRPAAAELWRRAMVERTADTADQHLNRLATLQEKYGMRLSTVSDRLGQRFVGPLTSDRLRALVRPAALDAAREQPSAAFTSLEQEAAELAEEPSGAGLDLPEWLANLDDEVERVVGSGGHYQLEAASDPLPWLRLAWQQVQEQLSNWDLAQLEDRS